MSCVEFRTATDVVRTPAAPWGRIACRAGTIAALAASIVAFAAHGAGVYQEIRVPWPNDPAKIFIHPDMEFMGDDDGSIRLLSRPDITEKLRASGVPVQIVHADLERHYAALQGDGGERGDFGIWHTYAETVLELNALHNEFPTLVTPPFSVGVTGEGRVIWAIKVSDNPALDEDEPEILFDGLHHAREIMTVEMLLSFPRYLCENYGADPAVTHIVDEREIWFVPIVNPDGFLWNETTNPGGGGMWRKNRRNNGGGCYGVDNNRNYPFEWIGPGSSTNPCDDTFRGPGPGSEPENQAIINLIDSRDFVVWQSYHSVAGMVLFPWGYTSTDTPDDSAFRAVAAEMASGGGYIYGQPPEILYSVNGGAFDWGYGETTLHQKLFGFTTEIGGTGFWPSPSERDGLIAENLHANIYLCQVAGPTVLYGGLAVQGGDANGRLDPGESVSLVVTVRNPAFFAPATGVLAGLRCDDPYIAITDARSTIGTIAAGDEVAASGDPFSLEIDPSCPAGRTVTFHVDVSADGGVVTSGSTSFMVGMPTLVWSNDFEQAGDEWMSDPTHTASLGAWARIDPNPTGFQPGDDTTLPPGVYGWITAQNSSDGTDDVDSGISASRSAVIDASGHGQLLLELQYFFGQRDPGDDPTGDFFRLDVSNNGGATFPVNLLSIGDIASPASWARYEVDLGAVIPLTSQMVFRVQASDGVATGDIIEAGLDDLALYDVGPDNEAPSAPQPLFPLEGTEVGTGSPNLTVANAVDPEGQPLTYGFRVYSDPDLTLLAATVDGVPGGAPNTSWTVSPVLSAGTYWWRCYAADPHTRGIYCPAQEFTVQTSTAAEATVNGGGLALVVEPNPARDAARVRYFIPSTPYVRIEILDVTGRRVREMDGARWSAGWHESVWDGRDDRGQQLPSGVYNVRVQIPGQIRTIGVVRLK